MDYIAEAMQASIDLTRTTSQDNVDNSRPSSSSSSTTCHPGLDTNFAIFYRPVYQANLEHQPVVYTPSAQYPPSMVIMHNALFLFGKDD